MINITRFNETDLPGEKEKKEIVDFLYKHLEQYGDDKPSIAKCLDYGLGIIEGFGGYVLVAREADEMVGAVIVNKTGMGGYIPDNILVYIATHHDHRGKGIGKRLMEETLELAEGDVKLHVEHDNPARFLYEKYGFTNKYREMRYSKK
jgi:ribosomal protein S18 acetylase RimI-like enzyme